MPQRSGAAVFSRVFALEIAAGDLAQAAGHLRMVVSNVAGTMYAAAAFYGSSPALPSIES
jgi:hypothetical protein